ncbi:hypothetical protein EON81_02130 [bacterium]|nr:MAG: hypothetical protein EON81_02130 [bacterium]
MKIDIVLDTLRSGEIKLVPDSSLGKAASGMLTIKEVDGEIPIPVEFLNNIDAFYKITSVRDWRGRRLPEMSQAASGELAYASGLNFDTKAAYLRLSIKK